MQHCAGITLRGFIFATLLLVGPISAVSPVRAATITVDTLVDESDGSCIDGDCSLRDAIVTAKAGDTVTFAPGTTGTLTLGSQLIINKDLFLQGPGEDALELAMPSIAYRHINVAAGTVTVSGLSFRRDNAFTGPGGCLKNGANLTLSHVTFTGCEAKDGGALHNSGTLDVTDATFADCGAPGRTGGALHNAAEATATLASTVIGWDPAAYSGGVGGKGGAIYNAGLLTAHDVTIAPTGWDDTTTVAGGGIYNDVGGTLALERASLDGNTAQKCGGLDNLGTATVTACAITRNLAGCAIPSATEPGGYTFTGEGGGLCNSGTLTLTNTTVSANHTYGRGGGMINTGLLRMEHGTVSGNEAGFRSASGCGGGIYNTDVYTTVVKHSLIAGNQAPGNTDACEGILISEDYNLIDSVSGCTITGTVTHTTVAADAAPFVMMDNGGPTWTAAITHTLVDAGSLAADQIPAALCSVATDQRGIPRPQNGACDIGAYEAAVISWSGSSSGDWDSDGSWDLGVHPGAGDIARLSTAGTANLTADAAIRTIGAVELTHTGASIVHTGGHLRPFNFTQSAGTYTGGPRVTLATRTGGAFALSGGTFTAPAVLELGGDFTHSGGTFDGNEGTTMLAGVVDQRLQGTTTFHALVAGGTGSRPITATHPISVTDVLHLQRGRLTGAPSAHGVRIDAGATLALTGDIAVSGDWTQHGALLTAGHTITYNGAAPQTLQHARDTDGTTGALGFLDDGRGSALTLDPLGQALDTVTATVRLHDDCTSSSGETFARCYGLAAQAPPATGTTVTFSFYAADIPAGQSCASAEAYHWTGDAWEQLSRAAAFGTNGRQCTTEPYALRATGITGLSPFVLKSDGVPTGYPPDGKTRVYLPLVVRGGIDVGCWMMDDGCWMVDGGWWMLDGGCWMTKLWTAIPSHNRS